MPPRNGTLKDRIKAPTGDRYRYTVSKARQVSK